MKTRDLSQYKAESNVLTFLRNIQGILTQGWSWYQSRKSQEELITILDEVLSDECLLLRDVTLPRVGKPIPLVLVAPSGLTVINPKNQLGYYRAEGKRWEELRKNDEFELAPSNLIRETWLYEKTIEGYFKKHQFKAPTHRSALIFVNPETHIESIRPRVRVIRADGILNFARKMAIAKPAFTDIDFRNAVNLLTHPELPKEPSMKPQPEPFSEESERTIPPKVEENIQKVSSRINFNRREWTILIALGVFLIIVLIALILLITLSQ
ncbi:MAG: NERD domain-containing protein [Anaerolineales bacterium]|nr:NERD domain-containing protein [Anaerolineales bacterium]